MKFLFFVFLFIEKCNGFFPALFNLERSVKIAANKPPFEENIFQLNELCSKLDKYKKDGICKPFISDLDGYWRLLSCTDESKHSFSYQYFDLKNNKASDTYKFKNGSVIENSYSILPTENSVFYNNKVEKITHNDRTININNYNDSMELELLYLSPSVRVDKTSDGKLFVYEPTPQP